jgi:hypothetical protein
MLVLLVRTYIWNVLAYHFSVEIIILCLHITLFNGAAAQEMGGETKNSLL